MNNEGERSTEEGESSASSSEHLQKQNVMPKTQRTQSFISFEDTQAHQQAEKRTEGFSKSLNAREHRRRRAAAQTTTKMMSAERGVGGEAAAKEVVAEAARAQAVMAAAAAGEEFSARTSGIATAGGNDDDGDSDRESAVLCWRRSPNNESLVSSRNERAQVQ